MTQKTKSCVRIGLSSARRVESWDVRCEAVEECLADGVPLRSIQKGFCGARKIPRRFSTATEPGSGV